MKNKWQRLNRKRRNTEEKCFFLKWLDKIQLRKVALTVSTKPTYGIWRLTWYFINYLATVILYISQICSSAVYEIWPEERRVLQKLQELKLIATIRYHQMTSVVVMWSQLELQRMMVVPHLEQTIFSQWLSMKSVLTDLQFI